MTEGTVGIMGNVGMGAGIRAVNRVLLGVLGVLLLAGGLAVLFGALDLPRRWGVALPAGWPWTGPEQVLLSDADRTRWRDEGWWWPVVIGGLAVVVLLAAWWLLAQVRRQRLTEVLVGSGDGAAAVLRGRALEDVLTAETQSLTGVEQSRVRLWGRRRRPRARVGMLLTPRAEPGDALERLRTEVLEHARSSTGLAELPAEVRLRGVRHRAERVS